MVQGARYSVLDTFPMATLRRSYYSGVWHRIGYKTIINKNLKKDMEKRKARIDTDVMERFVPSCSRCVNSVSDGEACIFAVSTRQGTTLP